MHAIACILANVLEHIAIADDEILNSRRINLSSGDVLSDGELRYNHD